MKIKKNIIISIYSDFKKYQRSFSTLHGFF
jgi:hypothetical protein